MGPKTTRWAIIFFSLLVMILAIYLAGHASRQGSDLPRQERTVSVSSNRAKERRFRKQQRQSQDERETDGTHESTVITEVSLVRGRVIDRRSRKPLEGAEVWFADRPEDKVITDEIGVYELAFSLELSKWMVIARADGYLQAEGGIDLNRGKSWRGPTLALIPADAALSGVVVDNRDKPLEGIELSIRFDKYRESAITQSTADGSFRFPALASGKTLQLWAKNPGFRYFHTQIEPLEPHEEQTGLKVVLSYGCTILGRLVDEQTGPVEGVNVLLIFGRSRHRDVFRTRSDGAGRFELTVRHWGDCRLRARGKGYAAGKRISIGRYSERLDLGTVYLERGVVLEGRVVTSGAKPLAGADIYLLEPDPGDMSSWSNDPGPPKREPEGTSDEEGFFLIPDRIRDQTIDVEVWRSGYTHVYRPGLTIPTEEPLVFMLAPTARISGWVVDSEGRPPDIGFLSLRLERKKGFSSRAQYLILVPADGGAFSFEDVEPGKYRIVAMVSGYQVSWSPGIEVASGIGPEPVDIVLQPGAILEGNVLDPKGKPAIDAAVNVVVSEMQDMDKMMYRSGDITDGDGWYRLDTVAQGLISVEANHHDYDRVVRDIEVRPGVNRLDLKFEEKEKGEYEVSGMVFSQDGSPIKDARISVKPMQTGDRYNFYGIQTNQNGSFVIKGVPDGGYHLFAHHRSYLSNEDGLAFQIAGGPVSGLRLSLAAKGAIVGRLIRLDPELLTSVRMTAKADNGRGGGDVEVHEDGTYRIANLEPGTWNVHARVSEGNRKASGTVILEKGVSEVDLPLVFEPGLTLDGRVLKAGDPLAGARVTLDRYGTVADQHGHFRISGLEPGQYTVAVGARRGELMHRRPINLEKDMEIVVNIPLVTLAGRVIADDGGTGTPLAGAKVSLGSSFRSATRTDAEGRFSLESTRTGRLRIIARKDGYVDGETNIEVGDGDIVDDILVTLLPAQELTLFVRLPAGPPPKVVSVNMAHERGKTVSKSQLRTGENGRVRMENVLAGTWDLMVYAQDGYLALKRNVPVPGPQQELQLVKGGILKITIPGVDGSKHGSLTISDEMGRAIPGTRFISRSGTTTLSVPPGTWNIRVHYADAGSWQGTATVLPDEISALELQRE